jgi:hypothetical protein
METDASTRPAGRPRPWLLVALAVVVAVALLFWLPGKSAAPSSVPSNSRAKQKAKTVENVQPGDLQVHLDALNEPRPEAEAGERNPFRFYVKPPPPPPTPPKVDPSTIQAPPGPVGPAPPPPPPPITLKYIGLLEVGNGEKVAAFSDCRSTMRGKEGDVIAGQYRLVHIGNESVVMEYVDGRGRATIRQSGQECVGK